jgi:DNA-binding NarL/FixJ family response regulator
MIPSFVAAEAGPALVTTKARVALIHPELLFRDILAGYLSSETDFEVVGEAETPQKARGLLEGSSPDILLASIDFPEQTIADMMSAIRARPGTRLLLLTAKADPRSIAVLLQSGAGGVFSMSTGARLLPKAIREVLAGSLWVDDTCLATFINSAHASPMDHEQRVNIGVREREVLEYICLGYSNKEISERLCPHLSDASVKAAIQRLFRAYGVRKRAQLIVTAKLSY